MKVEIKKSVTDSVNQEMSVQCPQIKKQIEIKGKLTDIYKEEIEDQTIETIVKISNYRKRMLEN